MRKEHRQRRAAGPALAGLIAAVAWTGAVWADESADEALTTLDSMAPLSAATLEASTAKAQIQVDKIQVNENDLNGVVSDNVAIGNTTGNNVVTDGAFSSSSGFMTTIQNTGNNVLIQNSTIITVSVEP